MSSEDFGAGRREPGEHRDALERGGVKVNRSKKNARVDLKETCNTEEARSRDSQGR